MGVRSRSDAGQINTSNMCHGCRNHQEGRTSRGCWSGTSCLCNQSLSVAGLGLKVVSGIERNPNLTMMAIPICVVSMPVKGATIYGPIVVNQLLFHEVVSIQLGIAKAVTRESPKLHVREGTKQVRERLLGQLNEGPSIINSQIGEQVDHIDVQVGSLWVL